MIVDINPPAAGASVTSTGAHAVTLYADAGRTTPVSLPLALPSYGTTTVYLPPSPRWEVQVVSAAGVSVWRGRGTTLTGEALTFRSVLGTGPEDVNQVIDGGSA